MQNWISLSTESKTTAPLTDFRSPAEGHAETGTQLTTYAEVEDVIEVKAPNNADFLWAQAQSLPPQGMSEVLSRSYFIDDFAWTELNTFLTEWHFAFPQSLFDIPQIENKLSFFKFFRCKGVCLSIRLNSTPYHYGALAFSHVVGVNSATIVDPDFGFSPNQHIQDPAQNLNNHAVLISAMTAESICINLPWDNPLQWIPIHTTVADGREAFIARATLTVLDVLKMVAAAVQPIQVSIFANFIEPEVQGMVATAESSDKVQLFSELQPQTVTVSDLEAFDEAVSTLMSQMYHGNPPSILIDNEEYCVFLDSLPIATSEASLAPNMAEAGRKGAKNMKKEVDQKSLGTLVSEFAESAIDTVKKGVEVGGKVAEYVEGAGDKPTVPISPTPVIFKGGISGYYGYGSSLSGKTSLRPDAKTSTDISLSTIGLNPTIAQIATTPAYDSSFVMTDARVKDYVLAQWGVAPNGLYAAAAGSMLTYARFMADMFKFWRGSMRYMIHVFCSKFVSARVRVSYFPGAVTADNPTNNLGGDVPSQVYDITGDMVIDFYVPYIAPTIYKATNSGIIGVPMETTGVVVVQVLNPITSIAAGSSIGFHLWQCMGADAQFGLFHGHNAASNQIRFNVPPPLLAQSESVVNRDPSLGEELVPLTGTQILGIVDSEQFTDYISLGKRLGSLELPGLPGTTSVIYSNLMFTNPDFTLKTEFDNHSWMSALFVWCRGAVRYRAFYDRAAVFTNIKYTNASAQDQSAYSEMGAASTGTDIEMPYFSNTTFQRVGGVGNIIGRYKYTIAPGGNVSAVGPDLTTKITGFKFGFGDDYGFSGMYSTPVSYTPPLEFENGVTARRRRKRSQPNLDKFVSKSKM